MERSQDLHVAHCTCPLLRLLAWWFTWPLSMALLRQAASPSPTRKRPREDAEPSGSAAVSSENIGGGSASGATRLSRLRWVPQVGQVPVPRILPCQLMSKK